MICIQEVSSVRFLISSSGTWSTVLFRFASSWISDEESSVVLKKKLLDLSFLSLVDEFLIISDNTFGDRLSDGVNLSDITSSSYGDSDVEVLESFKSQKKDGFHNFDSQ
jgi:hypothetical protein